MSEHGAIKIFCNGNPDQTQIAVVDSDGKETPLLVEGIAYELHANSDRRGRLRLDCCFGSSVRLEIPASGSVVEQLTELFSEAAVNAKADSHGKLRRAVEDAIERLRAGGGDESVSSDLEEALR